MEAVASRLLNLGRLDRLFDIGLGALAFAAEPFVSAFTRKARETAGLAAPLRRQAFVTTVPRGAVLEIGPFYCPRLRGTGIKYFDILDQNQSRERAAMLGLDPAGCPPIDYVSPTGDLRMVDEKFDAVFSSHCIEHQPDLIRHLCDVAGLLRPGGAYFLIIPDKRYCFDHFHPASTLTEICEAEGRTITTEAIISRNYRGMAHNYSKLHWLGWHGDRLNDSKGEAAAMASIGRGEYVDVHNWAFTPESFQEIAGYLSERTGLSVEAVHDTRVGAVEFMAVLRSHRV